MLASVPTLSAADLDRLRVAKKLLERPSLAARISEVVGAPIEKAIEMLPGDWSKVVNQATHKSLSTALRAALVTVDARSSAPPSLWTHKLLVTATGAGGGAFGLLGLPVELPLSTMVMLRSIADIARSEGEGLDGAEAKLACLEVFALGASAGPGASAADSGYFAVRSTLARAVAEATQYVATRGMVDDAAPVLVRFIGKIATRFGVPVSQKLAAQMVPAVGAAAGAAINLMFIEHYQSVARGHFGVRRLERVYGPELVRDTYALV